MPTDQDRVWDMMDEIDFCMFVTNASGRLRSRPMSSIIKRDEGYVYFLANARDAKDEEIASDPKILLAYSNGSSQFVSAEGTARISADRVLVKRLWNPGAQAFWPAGPDNPDIIAIIVRPSTAEYWDGPGTVVSSVKFAYALMTGATPAMGENAKVGM